MGEAVARELGLTDTTSGGDGGGVFRFYSDGSFKDAKKRQCNVLDIVAPTRNDKAGWGFVLYLPDVEVNRAYVKKQLEDYANGRNPRDQWINPDDTLTSEEKYEAHEFSEIGRKLMNIDEW